MRVNILFHFNVHCTLSLLSLLRLRHFLSWFSSFLSLWFHPLTTRTICSILFLHKSQCDLSDIKLQSLHPLLETLSDNLRILTATCACTIHVGPDELYVVFSRLTLRLALNLYTCCSHCLKLLSTLMGQSGLTGWRVLPIPSPALSVEYSRL